MNRNATLTANGIAVVLTLFFGVLAPAIGSPSDCPSVVVPSGIVVDSTCQ